MRRDGKIAIIGGGPAALMAAERLSGHGYRVAIYDAMPTVGRKFLLAGKSGLNLTHAEEYPTFVGRFGPAAARLEPALQLFGPKEVRTWADGLGAQTFVGTSGRIFPAAMKASPLLRAWLARLKSQGVSILTRHRWMGFEQDSLRFDTPDGRLIVRPDATVLALGGASWPRLGSDAQWIGPLQGLGVRITALQPANCGFDVDWSPYFRDRFAGTAVKAVVATTGNVTQQGEFVITRHGIEGSLVYAHAASLRDHLMEGRRAVLWLDLAPGRTAERLQRDLARSGSKASLANRLRKAAGIDGVKAALLREFADPDSLTDALRLAGAIKALPLTVTRPRPIEEAISSAGGVNWLDIDQNYMLEKAPGVFVAGEMLDWEAPTGGYLLTACMATGAAAAQGIQNWLAA